MNGKFLISVQLELCFHILYSLSSILVFQITFEARYGNSRFKGQLQRFYKLVLYERAVKMLKNDICITEIGQAVLKIFEFKLEFPRKIPKIRNLANVSIIRAEQ